MKHVFYFFIFISCLSYSQETSIEEISISEIKGLEKNGEIQEASQLLLQKIEAYKNVDENQIANLYEKQYDYYFSLTKKPEEKEAYSKQLVNLRENAKKTDTLGLVKAYFYYATFQNNVAIDHKKALFYNEKAITFWHLKFNKPTDLLAKSYTQKASFLHNLGFEGESFVAYEKAAQLYENIPNPDNYHLSSLYNSLGTNYIRYGFYDKANFYLSKARNYIENNVDILLNYEKQESVEYAFLLHNYAQFSRLHKDTGNEKELLKLIETAESFVKNKILSKRASYNLSAVYNYTGLYYLYETKKYQKALYFFTKAKNSIPKGYLVVYHDYYLLNIAKAKIGLHQEKDALLELNYLINERNIPKSLKGFLFAARSQIYTQKNQLTLSLSDANEAVSYFSKAENTVDILSDSLFTQYVPSKRLNDTQQLLNIAKTLQNYPVKSDSLLIATNNIYKIALLQFKNCYTKNFYSAKLEKMFGEIVLGIMTTNKLRYGNYDPNNEILKNNIDYKSKFLWHKFLVNNNNNILKIPDSLITLEQNLRKKLSLYQTEKDEENNQIYDHLILDIKEQLYKLSEKIEEKYVSFSYFNQNNFNLSHFIKNIDTNQAYLKYEKIDSHLFVFIIEKSKVSTINLGDYSSIEKEVKIFIKNANKKVGVVIKKEGEGLYNKLGLNYVSSYSHLTIIPDKILYFLSFDILTENEKYLIESKNIKYANSLPLLQFKPHKTENKESNSLTFFTPSYKNASLNKLQGAALETKKIKKIIPSTAYLRANATKENFINNTKQQGFLHLAMHAFINDNHPELSNLVFSDAKEDYKLFISELYGLNFNFDLAVLSACKTGVGGFKEGMGLVSLSRAFTYSGVPATISSLWSAPDNSTKEIMVSFYENLKNGETKSTALRNAKLSYLGSTKNSDLKTPFYWAGFVMYGNNDVILFPETNYYKWVWVGLFLGILFLLWLFKTRKLKRKV